MLTLEPMQKLRVACLRERVEPVVAALYEFGAIQVTRSRHGTPDVPMASFEKISEELIALRAVEKLLKIDFPPEKRMPPELRQLLRESAKLRKEFSQAGDALSQIEALKAREAQLREKLAGLLPFKELRVPPSTFRKTARLSFEYRELKATEQDLRKALKDLPVELAFARPPAGFFVLAAFPKDDARVKHALERHCGPAIEVPEVAEKSFVEAHAAVERGLAGLQSERASLLKSVDSFVKARGAEIAQLRADLEEHAKQAELPNKFGRTEFLEAIEGWVEERKFAAMQRKVFDSTGGKALVERVSASEEPPSELSNPPGVRRFEFLVKFFSLPSAHELDPTLFIAVTFPIIFGMIFGDIGYGLLAVLLGAFLRSKQGFLSDIGGMMVLSGASTTAFGWVFGEFFGGEEMLGYHLTPLIHRSGHGVEVLFGVTLVVGVLHLGLGLLIGLATNLRARHYGHAAAKFCWLLVEAGMVLSIYSIVMKQPEFGLPGAAVLFAGVAGLFKLEGVQGLVEVPGLLANGLSYLRILALGLSGVILALIVNQIPVAASFQAFLKTLEGGFNPLAFAGALLTLAFFSVFLVLGHGLALGLGLFESGIQSLRLHYVEFFSKFYHGGGMPFVPLREKRG